MLTIGTFKELSLEQLSDWIWGNEVGYGPVKAIGNTGDRTAATFEYSLTEPKGRADVRPLAAGAAIAPAGKALVCKGKVFIASQLQEVGVYR